MSQTGCWYDHIGAAGRPLDKCPHYQHEANFVHEQPTFDSVGLEPCHLALLHLVFHVFGNLRCRLGGRAPELIGMQVRYCLTCRPSMRPSSVSQAASKLSLDGAPIVAAINSTCALAWLQACTQCKGRHAWHCQWHQITDRSSMHLVRCPAKGACQGVYMS